MATAAPRKELTRKEQKEQTRRELIVAATRLFQREGILKTTTADVAKACKVSHGTVFVHFPSREELVAAVIDDFGARLSQRFGSERDNKTDLRGALQAHLSVLDEFEDFYAHLLTDLHQLPPSVRSTVFMLQAAVAWRIWNCAEAEMAQGRLKKMEKPLFINTWLALLHYYISNRDLFSKGRSVLAEKGDELIGHFLHMVRK